MELAKENVFVTFFQHFCFISVYSVLKNLSEYIYFHMSKNITSCTFLLVKIVENLQCIPKLEVHLPEHAFSQKKSSIDDANSASISALARRPLPLISKRCAGDNVGSHFQRPIHAWVWSLRIFIFKKQKTWFLLKPKSLSIAFEVCLYFSLQN